MHLPSTVAACAALLCGAVGAQSQELFQFNQRAVVHPVVLTDVVECVGTIADLEALPLPSPSKVRCVRVLGYHAPGDGGGGEFWWDPAEKDPVDGGLTFASTTPLQQGRWKRLTDGQPLSATWFGAIPNDPSDDFDALQAAISYAETRVGGLWPDERNVAGLYLPAGAYHVSGTLRIRGALDLYGADSSATTLIHTGQLDLLRIESDDLVWSEKDDDVIPDALYDVSLRRLTLEGNWNAEAQTSETRFGVYAYHGIRGCTLEDVAILRCQTGAFLRRCYTAKIVNCVMMFCTQHCLKWENATAGLISGSRFDVIPTGSHCAFVTFDHTNGEETLGLQVEASSFQGSGLAGLYCRDVGNLTVVSCFFENNNRSDLGYGSLHLEDSNDQPYDTQEHVLTVIGGFFSPGSEGKPSSRAIDVENTDKVNLIGVDVRGSNFQFAVEAHSGVQDLNLIGCKFHGRPNAILPGVKVHVVGSD